jgi:hypothetical protein
VLLVPAPAASCWVDVQEGVRPSAGVFLAACALAAILAMLLPIETKGRQLFEGDEDVEHEVAGTLETEMHHISAESGSNPFHTNDFTSQALPSPASLLDPKTSTARV